MRIIVKIEPECRCAEGWYLPKGSQESVLAPQGHHCRYVRERNALLPKAMVLEEQGKLRTWRFDPGLMETLVAEAKPGG